VKNRLNLLERINLDDISSLQDKIDQKLEKIHHIIREAEAEVIKYKINQNNIPKLQNGFKRNKKWWNKELEGYKKEIKNQYKI
jgi:hypothetical protein